jgi:hypothetical protein
VEPAQDGEGTYRVTAEEDRGRSLSTRIIFAVAEITETEPTELRPLNDVVDPEALDDLFEERVAGNDTDLVAFNYAGVRVSVYRDGELLLQLRQATPPVSDGDDSA